VGIFYAFFDIYKEMKDLIRKILKEEYDDLEWAKGLDISAAEKEIKRPFKEVTDNHNFDGNELYDLLVDAGIRDLEKLKGIGSWVSDSVTSVYDGAYESAQDNFDCDGCCDDYYYQDQVNEMTNDAREEGDSEGYERGQEDSQSEIDELKGQISELQDTIEELHNKLTS
jgi:hypothetical protein